MSDKTGGSQHPFATCKSRVTEQRMTCTIPAPCVRHQSFGSWNRLILTLRDGPLSNCAECFPTDEVMVTPKKSNMELEIIKRSASLHDKEQDDEEAMHRTETG